MILKIFIISFLIIQTRPGFCLSPGDKLHVQILDTSKTKRTILLNRGLSAGLTIEEHGNFYLDEGLIARGVAIKVSPSRSVWAIYLIYKKEHLFNKSKLQLKITNKMKLTDDKSKMLKPAINISGEEEYQLSRDAGKLLNKMSKEEKEEFTRFEVQANNQSQGLFENKNSDIWLIWDLDLLKTITKTNNTSNSSNTLSLKYALGYEKYLDKFINKASLSIFLLEEYTSTTASSNRTRENIIEIGVGPSWHFFNDPMFYGYIIGFTYAHFGIGTMSYKANNKSFNSTSTNFMTLGLGFKYYLIKGLGARIMFEYISRNKKLYINKTDKTDINVNGLQFHLGISYRM